MYSKNFKIKIFADGADLNHIISLNENNKISGFTTNPTLMRKAGVENYKNFSLDVLSYVKKKPISFEVFSDDFKQMYKQAKIISSWSENVNVKIPISNSQGQSSIELIKKLHNENIKLNITAVFTLEQIKNLSEVLTRNTYSIVSVFAGRIADTGIDPVPIMKEAKSILSNPNINLLWASPREILNFVQAEDCMVDIITLTPDLIKKIDNLGKSLSEFSLETVNMFYQDAKSSRFVL